MIQEPPVSCNLRFPGQYYQAETGLNQNYFRDYDPLVGRYLESDPIGLQGGLNTYVYVGNNTLIFIDRFGLCWMYVQSKGELLHIDSSGYADYSANGYAGYGAGQDDPAWQNVSGEPPDPSGPLPQGYYNIGPQQDYVTTKGKTLYGALYLTPRKGTDMHRRGGFLIHGPHANDQHDSSNGCPIFVKPVRDKVANSGDTCLEVVP